MHAFSPSKQNQRNSDAVGGASIDNFLTSQWGETKTSLEPPRKKRKLNTILDPPNPLSRNVSHKSEDSSKEQSTSKSKANPPPDTKNLIAELRAKALASQARAKAKKTGKTSRPQESPGWRNWKFHFLAF